MEIKFSRIKSFIYYSLSIFFIGIISCSLFLFGINRRNRDTDRIERERLAELERNRTAYYNREAITTEREREFGISIQNLDKGLQEIESGALQAIELIDRIESRNEKIKSLVNEMEDSGD